MSAPRWKLPALRIQHRIVIPFTLLFVATTLLVAFVSVSLISRTLDRRVRNQIDHVSEMISETGFALNPPILEKLKLVIGADIITYRRDGQVIAATFDPTDVDASASLLGQVQSAAVIEALFGERAPLVIRDLIHDGLPYKAAYRRLRSPPDTLVAIVVPTSDVAAAKRAIARSMALIAVGIAVVMAFVSQAIARSITSPVNRLVEFTGKLAAGDLTHRAPVESRDEIGSLVQAFNDMVRRLRASEEELLRTEKLAVAGQLAARVAHDIRNPLSSIRIQAQLLRAKLPPEDAQSDALEAILREIDRVERVVKGLLDLATPGDVHLELGSANEVVEEALRSTEGKLRHLKIRVKRHYDATLPPVLLDADRLSGAVLNLIQNAADAMPEGGALFVSTEIESGGRAIRIEIRDEGTGVDPAHGEKLFDPFFTTKRDGVGLGLLNARGVVERHAGTIELLPGDGAGTRAVITLPLPGAPPP